MIILIIRYFSGCIHTERQVTNASVREKRNALFEAEKQRQLSLLARIEKIEVQYKGQPEDCTLVMNKNLSTPFNCAMRKWISLVWIIWWEGGGGDGWEGGVVGWGWS